jgi:hypothetical protein
MIWLSYHYLEGVFDIQARAQNGERFPSMLLTLERLIVIRISIE